MRLLAALALTLLLSFPCLAYPEAAKSRPGVLDSQGVETFAQYQEKGRPNFKGYQENRPKTALTDQPSESKTFQDFQQRKAKKEAFELYHKADEHYEKEPRFRY